MFGSHYEKLTMLDMRWFREELNEVTSYLASIRTSTLFSKAILF